MSHGDRKRPFLLMLSVSLLLAAPNLRLSTGHAQTLHLSPSGSDSSPGTQTQPFRTLQRARQAVREAIAAGMKQDLTVVLHAGSYFLAAPLRFDERDSGREGHRVIWRGAHDEEARLVGGKRVEGWKRGRLTPPRPNNPTTQPPVFVAEIDEGWKPNVLTENGVPAVMARTPNVGYFQVKQVLPGENLTRFVYGRGDLPEFEPRGAQTLVWAGFHEEWDGGKNYNWEASLLPIAAVDADARVITLEGQTIRDLHARNRYAVRGALAFLDEPGEFYVDAEAGRLFYWPRRMPIEEQEIIASTTLRVVEIIGKAETRQPGSGIEGMEGGKRDETQSSVLIAQSSAFSPQSSVLSPDEVETTAEEMQVGNLVFENLTLEVSQAYEAFGPDLYLACEGLVYISGAHHVTIRNCRIRNAGASGLALHLGNRGHVVEGNLIEDCGHHGVALGGHWLGSGGFESAAASYVHRDHAVHNNHIRRCGRLIAQASGIWLYQSGDNEISHNLIEEMPRYGVRMIGASYAALRRLADQEADGGRLPGMPLTWENHLDFLHTRNNRIVFNEIRYCMQDSQDGGGICTYGTGSGNLIADNFVHDLRTRVTEGAVAGIYLDDASNHFTVTRNIIARLRGSRYAFPLIIKGYDNAATNNFLADNQATAAVYVMQTPHGGLDPKEGMPEELTDRLRFSRNIFYRNTGLVYRLYPWKDTLLLESDSNILYRPEGDYRCEVDWTWESWQDWSRRLQGRYERHTLCEDPLFVDPDTLDYRLRAGSPALRNGFEPIDLSQIGLLHSPGAQRTNDRTG